MSSEPGRETVSFSQRRAALEAERVEIAARQRFRALTFGSKAQFGMWFAILLGVAVVTGLILLAQRGQIGREAIVSVIYGLSIAVVAAVFLWHAGVARPRPSSQRGRLR